MFTLQRSVCGLILVGLVGGSAPALAADAPIPTADANAPGIAAQIDDYLKTSPAITLPKDGAVGVTPGDEDEPRKVHGVVDVAVGSHGYRSAYVRSDIPVGKTGTLSIAVQESRFKGRGGYEYEGYGYDGYEVRAERSQNLGLGLALSGATQDEAGRRCRDDGQIRRHRIDPAPARALDSGRSHACTHRDIFPDDR
jgi:hypothetical protein